jgi:hypothetical protein
MGLITSISALILQFYPSFVEAFYSEGLFVAVRWVLDNTLGKLPFSIFYSTVIQNQFPCYCVHPHITKQGDGYSDIVQKNVSYKLNI